jgi:predicted N-acetyltransferase YhbS
LPSTSTLLIRLADLKDIADLRSLTRELGYDADHTEIADRLRQIQNNDDHLLLVAEQENAIIGWLHLFLAFRLESPGSVEIGGLVVSPQWRHKGIAEKLLEIGKEWAKSKDIKQVRVRVNVMRKEAFDFYQHMGFQKVKDQTTFNLKI